MEDLPNNRVGLMLGTSKYIKGGKINKYYSNRIEATIKLYRSKKIEFVLVSGDNSMGSYNEPRNIYQNLINMGIPKNKIYLDFAGFRTFDSMIRAQKIFGCNNLTIISQEFHNKRALFIAKHIGIEAVAFNAKEVGILEGIKVHSREFIARTAMFLDLYIFKSQPKFLGEKIEIK